MSNAVLKGHASGTGTVTLETPNTNTDKTISLPDRAGTLSMDGPAFRAYQSSQQTISTNTDTKVQFQTESFDTNSNYDKDTSYRFQPTVSGYYQINANISFAGSTVNTSGIFIYRNGSKYTSGSAVPNNTNLGACCTASDVIYFNGSTDYVEIYIWQNTGSNLSLQTGTSQNVFSGSMVRAA